MSQSQARKKADAIRPQRENTASNAVFRTRSENTKRLVVTILVGSLLAGIISCKSISDQFGRDVRPLVMRDVPAQRMAFRFEGDIEPPPEIKNEDADDKIESIQLDFNTRRQDDALIRTVRSPDGQRALALYGTSDEPSQAFRIDLYSSEGSFLRNVTPPDISCVFAEAVAWSPDGNFITFIAHKSVKPTPTPTPPGTLPTETFEPSPLPSIAPAFASIAVFNTEQIYICNRDGYDLKPLTSREGLIYFYSSWAPDNHALVALACRESEWDAREREFKLPAGRPRLIALDGSERLLSDDLTEALPVWSPDSSKVATAFDADVMIHDAATTKPTQARIRLRDALIAASRSYERKAAASKEKGEANNAPAVEAGDNNDQIPSSFNPIIRLEWLIPEKLLFQTAYIRLIPNEPISTFQRWHILTLSPQAAVLK